VEYLCDSVEHSIILTHAPFLRLSGDQYVMMGGRSLGLGCHLVRVLLCEVGGCLFAIHSSIDHDWVGVGCYSTLQK